MKSTQEMSADSGSDQATTAVQRAALSTLGRRDTTRRVNVCGSWSFELLNFWCTQLREDAKEME